MLAGAVSMLPGGLGGAEATLIALLCLWGLTLSTAVAATLLINVATLWLAVLLGVIALSIHARFSAGRLAPASTYRMTHLSRRWR